MIHYNKWSQPSNLNPLYSKRVAYFSMEFAIHQSLKTYSGGLGFLSGSHMRSAFDLRQNMVGIGMLWKYGYYDQERNEDQTMRVQFQKKYYTFLEYSGITVTVSIDNHPVLVKALTLKPEIFGTVPIYFLTTDVPENDHLARTITHRLYDQNPKTRISQSIVLGVGGGKVVEALGGADIYHMNEGHALPLGFYLYDKFKGIEEVKQRLVFTTHTPEKAGNEEHDILLLHLMGFFGNLSLDEVRKITGVQGQMFNHSLAALRLAKVANGVSQLHGEVARQMWRGNEGICEIKAITNTQNVPFWTDRILREAMLRNDDKMLRRRKAKKKKQLFDLIADQTGKLFDPEVLTIVWARRFAAYKRPDLLLRNLQRFNDLVSRKEMPVQIIWAGKPYPFDYGAVDVFNRLVHVSYKLPNVAVLTGYELGLSQKLKQGCDIWLNTPRRPREASGTSGMTAAMNGAINFSVQDGWIPEYARHGENSFLIPVADVNLSEDLQNEADYQNMMRLLEEEIIPTYYNYPDKWTAIMKQSMRDIVPKFGGERMAHEYYEIMYK